MTKGNDSKRERLRQSDQNTKQLLGSTREPTLNWGRRLNFMGLHQNLAGANISSFPTLTTHFETNAG
jgi:hypothetical protein